MRTQGWAEAEKAKAQRNPAAMREHEQIFGQAPRRFRPHRWPCGRGTRDDRADDGQGEQVNSSSSSTRFPELRSDPDAGFWLSVQSTIPDGVRSLLIYHLHSLFRLAGKG